MSRPARSVDAGPTGPHPPLDISGWVHLQRLMGTWGMLADLSFSDLLLLVPAVGAPTGEFTVLGQIRPTTSQTLHREDLVGIQLTATERPLAARCWRTGQITEGELATRGRAERTRNQCIPVRHEGKVIAVLSRESYFGVGRRPGELERVYLELFGRLARMIVDGVFPFATDEATVAESPRVGDGVMVLGREQRVSYVSPNAVNALHRLGVHSALDGKRMPDIGLGEAPVDRAWQTASPVIEEVERPNDVSVLFRCVPLIADLEVRGMLILLRDVTDLRLRDRLLLSKDATIREIHHRVKNNLQTISSLLRLQGRRLVSEEGKEALREAEVRVKAMAAVHEFMLRETGDQVPFDQIVPALVRMAVDAVVTQRPVEIGVSGDAGDLPAEVATPLALALSELLQNAVQHAFPDDGGLEPGAVEINFTAGKGMITVRVSDNGRGLPEGFSIEESPTLGLSIVRDLVVTQLRGDISLHHNGGTEVTLRIPLPDGGDQLEG